VGFDLLNTALPRGIGPSKDVQETASKTDAQSSLRMGVVTAVTTRGITVAVGPQTVDAAHLDSYAPAVGDPVALMAVQDTWLALGRVVGPGNPTDNSAAGPGMGPSLIAGGIVTLAGNATLATTTGATVAVPKYSQTYFHPANHVVLAVAGFTWQGSTAATIANFFLSEATTAIGYGLFRRTTGTAAIDQFDTVSGILPASLGGTVRRAILQVATQGGGTTTAKEGNGIGRGFLYLMDLGDASFMPTA
jgi:hypothetical protein